APEGSVTTPEMLADTCACTGEKPIDIRKTASRGHQIRRRSHPRSSPRRRPAELNHVSGIARESIFGTPLMTGGLARSQTPSELLSKHNDSIWFITLCQTDLIRMACG